MADAADIANERQDLMIEKALAGRARFQGVSLAHCEECDSAIPKRRRELLAGVTRCVDCQQLKEERRT